MRKPHCKHCPNHPTLAIPSNSVPVIRHLLKHDIAVLDGPRPETLGRVVFSNADGKALRLVKAFFDTPRKAGD